MSQLSSELWVGVSTPAQIRLQPTSQAIGVKAPTSATALLGMTSDARVFSGAITFQDRITALSKKGGEITFRTVFRLCWKWKRSVQPLKITERTREKDTKALHSRRESRHSEAAFIEPGADF